MSTIVSPPINTPAGSVEKLIEQLRGDNPSAKITAVPFAHGSAQQPAQRVQMTVSAPRLKLTLAVLLKDTGLELVDLIANRSGTDANVTFIFNVLRP